MKDVQDELSSLRWLAQEYNETATAATAAREAADLSLTLYCDGASSFLAVVTTQSAALDAERLVIALHTRQRGGHRLDARPWGADRAARTALRSALSRRYFRCRRMRTNNVPRYVLVSQGQHYACEALAVI
jgi:hypothetical protein